MLESRCQEDSFKSHKDKKVTTATAGLLRLFFAWGCVLIFSCLIQSVSAQVFPVQVNTQIMPPFTPYLSDYTAPGLQKLMVQIRVNDPTLSDYTCKLRLTIEGVNISIRTRQSFVPRPITLQGGGVPQIFYGEDLAEYFDPNALDFAGISRNDYQKGAKLPEGLYRFTIEVLDYNRGTTVSNKGTAMAWVVLNDPPLLNLPRLQSKVSIVNPTNIPFTWTPRHTGSPNAAFTTEYVFRIVEIWPAGRNPYDAFLSEPVLYETVTNQTQVIYGPAEPALLPGRQYAWQVQARDTEGRDLFKNQGKSEVFVFQFGDELGIPESLTLQSSSASSLTVRWEQPVAGSDPVSYRVRYRPHGNRQTEAWYEATTQDQWRALTFLQPATEYEVQVRAEQAVQNSDYSPVQVFKTAEMGANEFVCRPDVSPPPVPATQTPLFALSMNDTIKAGGYSVLVREVKPGAAAGSYTGTGVAIVPWFNDAKVRVTFENIRVNQQFWLTSGEIKTVWDANSKFLIKSQQPTNPANAPRTGEVPVNLVATDSLVEIKGAAIVSVTKDDEGNIVVQTSDGATKVLAKGESYSITDEVGNGYVVDKDGNITKTTATEAIAANQRGDRNYNIQLRFEKGEGKFGFDEKKYDALAQYYQQLEDGNFIAWKAVSSTPDKVSAALTATGIDSRKIHFDLSGTPVMADANGSKFTLALTGKAEGTAEELLALYTAAEGAKDEVLGKLNVVSYSQLTRNLVIVPVNNVKLPTQLTTTILSQKLSEIYSQAVTSWQVSFADKITVTLGDKFDDGETGLLTNYTDDMKKVIRAFGNLQNDTYYLFLVEKPKSGADAFGYMPRSKQAGFIFVDNHHDDADKLVNTIAHELGHGAFHLKHTFSEISALAEGSTANLMDHTNGSGTELNKYQWDFIHDPASVIALFDDDEEGQNLNVALFEESTQLTDNSTLGATVKCNSKLVLLGSNVVAEFDEATWQSVNGKLNIDNNRLQSFQIGSDVYRPMFNVEKEGGKYKGPISSYYFVCWEKVKQVANDSKSGIRSFYLSDKDGKQHLVYTGVSSSPYAIALHNINGCAGKEVIGNNLNCYTVKASDCSTGNSNLAGTGQKKGVVKDFTNEGVDLSEIADLLAGKEVQSDRLRGKIQTTHAILFLTSTKTSDADYQFVQEYVPKGDTIKLWIHKDAEGKWFVKNAPNFDKISTAYNKIYAGYSFDLNKELATLNYGAKELATALYKISDWLSSVISQAYIPESWWNCDDKSKYDPPLYIKIVQIMLAPFATLVEQLAYKIDPTLEQQVKASAGQLTFAAIAGIWDGFVGMFDALPQAVKMLTMSFADDPKAQNEYSKFSKLIDDQGGGFPGFCSVMWQGLKSQFDIGKPCVFAHTVGEFGFAVLAAIYTGGAGASSKVGQIIQSTLKVLDRLDVLGNAIGSVSSKALKVVFRGASKVITVSTRAGLDIIECTIEGGRYSFKVLNAARKAFNQVDWSFVKEVAYYGLDGNTYTQKVWSDQPLQDYMLKMKAILRDENGNVVRNEQGEMLAVMQNTSDNTDVRTVVIKDDDGAVSKSMDEVARVTDNVIENVDVYEEVAEKSSQNLPLSEVETKELDDLTKVDEAAYNDPTIKTDENYRKKMGQKHGGKGRATKDWRKQAIGTNKNHAKIKDDLCQTLQDLGATDIRVNQAHTDINGMALGINRPDIQFNFADNQGNIRRYYVEIDANASGRGEPHKIRIQRNDTGANLARDALPDDLKHIELQINGKKLSLEGSVTLWQFD
jgi:hypothetical protein